MDTSITSPNKPDRRPKKIDHGKTIALAKRGMSRSEIAKIQGCDKSNITRVLQRYGVIQRHMDNYTSHRASILAGLQDRILQSITHSDVQKTPASQRVVMAGILYDKERLERGQSTEIIDHRVITAKLSEVTDRLKSINAGFTISHQSEDAGDIKNN